MNNAHWHIMLTHLPLTGTIFSTILLTAGMILKNQVLKNTGVCFFILTGLLAIPAFLTGEGAEEILESIGQENEFFIHQHEELAEKAFWISEVLAILSIAALSGIIKGKIYGKRLMVIVLFAGILNSVLMIATGNLGGQIRHTEIRPANSTPLEKNMDEH